MSPTASDIYTEESIMKEVFNCIPDLSDRDPKTDTQSAETWVSRNRRPFMRLQDLLKKWSPDLSNEGRIEVIQDDEVILFCQDQSLIKYLGLAENLIKKHFSTACKITFYLKYDPETSDKWVGVDTEISAEIDQVIEWENNFVQEWVASVPYPEREKIRLSCDII